MEYSCYIQKIKIKWNYENEYTEIKVNRKICSIASILIIGMSGAAQAEDVPFEESVGTCATYADNAIAQVQRAEQFSCGFSGGRWTTSRKAHWDWCTEQNGGGLSGAAQSEERGRNEQLASCAPPQETANAPKEPDSPRCLTMWNQQPRGPDGRGENVIDWPCAFEAETQQLSWPEDTGSPMRPQNISARMPDGRLFCLDVDLGEPVGSNGEGFNVMAWPECHNGENQKWYSIPNTRYKIGIELNGWQYCLTVNYKEIIPINNNKKTGYNVIVSANCQLDKGQNWHIRQP
jgi:hypothetical protein